MANKCEAFFNGNWNIIDIETALLYPELTKRCAECKGAVRIHREGKGVSAHAEHRKRFDYCSYSFYFNGTRKLNPEQPTPKDSQISFLPEEVMGNNEFYEGKTTTIKINKYERDSKARKECLNIHGYTCKVCEMNLEDKYGEVAKQFIHVHHLKLLSSIKKRYKVNPATDLIPVCPNCHAIIHRNIKPYTVEQVKKFLKNPIIKQVTKK